MSPILGMKLEQSVNSTEDGWSQSKRRQSLIVSRDMAIHLIVMHTFGPMVTLVKMFVPKKLSISGKKDDTGVWIHATDNVDMTWFGQLWNCWLSWEYLQVGGDAIEIYLGGQKTVQGAYCDHFTDKLRYFICEGIIQF